MVRAFRLPSLAVNNGSSSRFDPNVGLGFVPLKVHNPGEILDKANLRLAKYGIDPIRKGDLKSSDNISAEVGDDEESLCKSKAFAALVAYNHLRFGMKVSEEDTCINPRYGNFAEDLICLPDGYGQTYLNARKTSRAEDMSYIDIPKLRLAIDIRPMKMDHSGTNDGKASMVGSRLRWIPKNSPWRGQYDLFSLFQDVNLGLIRDRKFSMFPPSLGGYGKEPPFFTYQNFERFCHAFKQGSHSELIREVVWRTRRYLHALGGDVHPAKDPLLSHLVRFQSSFHDWVKGRSIYAPVTWVDVPPEVAKFRIAKTGRTPHEDEAINRLLAERRILSESQLEIAVEHNELCKALLGAVNIADFKRIRDKARASWNDLSIFSMENYGLIKEIGLEMSNRSRKLGLDEVRDFYACIHAKRFTLRHVLREEFVYSMEAMDEIYKVGPMKVYFDMYPRVGDTIRGFAAPSRAYNTDVEDTEEIGALDELLDWLKSNGRTGKSLSQMPRVIINDDSAIIRECSFYPYNCIVTDDKKLCREAARKTRNVIFRVPVFWYYRNIYFGSISWTDYLQELFPTLEWQTHEDSGSIKSFEENYFLDGVPLAEPARMKFNPSKELRQRDQTHIVEIEDFDWAPTMELARSCLIDPRNVLRTRKF